MGQNGNGRLQASLSAEEARLAALLAQGQGSEEIAHAIGVGRPELERLLTGLELKLQMRGQEQTRS